MNVWMKGKLKAIKGTNNKGKDRLNDEITKRRWINERVNKIKNKLENERRDEGR